MSRPDWENQRMPSCSELADGLEALPSTLREARRMRGLSLREAAAKSGLPLATIVRAESGKGLTVRSAVSLLRWFALEGESARAALEAFERAHPVA